IRQRENFSRTFRVIKSYLGDQALDRTIVAFTNLTKKQTEYPQFQETLPRNAGTFDFSTFNEIRNAEDREAEARNAAGAGCFKLDTEVMLINRKVVPMSSVRVGDQVCCGAINGTLKFSKVYLIAHRSFEAETIFLKVEFRALDGTEGNLENLMRSERYPRLQVLIGTRLLQAYVLTCTRETHEGYIALFTMSGTIVANNVLCSCYAVCPPYQKIIHFLLFPLRLSAKVYTSNNEKYTSNNGEVH
ncbi:13726_t:CDS:2, partial [Racocetra persica]